MTGNIARSTKHGALREARGAVPTRTVAGLSAAAVSVRRRCGKNTAIAPSLCARGAPRRPAIERHLNVDDRPAAWEGRFWACFLRGVTRRRARHLRPTHRRDWSADCRLTFMVRTGAATCNIGNSELYREG